MLITEADRKDYVKMEELTKEQAKAEVLIEALPYIQKFNRKIIVV
ncbi:MAG TPA: acetylglutamate kinase, partial [Eubacterium sp.]|nr:acetylglutamate kinase [Eubacterium sp.]